MILPDGFEPLLTRPLWIAANECTRLDKMANDLRDMAGRAHANRIVCESALRAEVERLEMLPAAIRKI